MTGLEPSSRIVTPQVAVYMVISVTWEVVNTGISFLLHELKNIHKLTNNTDPVMMTDLFIMAVMSLKVENFVQIYI
jgi:hypothetical protein